MPKITHLQYAVLSSMDRHIWSIGCSVRQAMGSKFQVKISGPRFYQLVKRMEESGFLRSQKGTPLTASLSMYQMTTLGRDEIDKAKAWYR